MKRIVTLMLCIAIVCSSAVSLTSCKSTDYEKALELIEAGSYAEAKVLLEGLGDYKDAKEYLSRFLYVPTTVTFASEEGTSCREISLNEAQLPELIFWDGNTETDYDEYFYDEHGNIIRRIFVDSKGIETYEDNTYDENGLLIKEVLTGPIFNSIYEFSYDENNRLVEQTSSNASGVVASVERFTYDEHGNLIKDEYEWDDVQIVTEYFYDEENRLVKELSRRQFGIDTINYTYDSKGNLIRTDFIDLDGDADVLSCIYDENGNKLKHIHTYADGGSYTLEYSYDGNGNIVRREFSSFGVPNETLTIEYTLIYTPFELPEKTRDKIVSLSDY